MKAGAPVPSQIRAFLISRSSMASPLSAASPGPRGLKNGQFGSRGGQDFSARARWALAARSASLASGNPYRPREALTRPRPRIPAAAARKHGRIRPFAPGTPDAL